MTITFRNPGLIDRAAVTTLGISVKESENPIGFFGTGIKYAIASILRGGGEITIWRGRKPMEFKALEIDVRGQKFQRVYMNGSPLGFTTDLGKTWQPWMVLRELWSNTKDEGGEIFSGSAPHPENNFTTIEVNWPALEAAWEKKHQYFLGERGEPAYHAEEVELYSGPSNTIFYKGVAVWTTKYPMQFTPNITFNTILSEDRTLLDHYGFRYRIAKAVHISINEDFIIKMLHAPEESWEAKELDLDYDFGSETSDQFRRLCRKAVSMNLSYSPSLRFVTERWDNEGHSAQQIARLIVAVADYDIWQLCALIIEEPEYLTSYKFSELRRAIEARHQILLDARSAE